jgi:hypothetical protein
VAGWPAQQPYFYYAVPSPSGYQLPLSSWAISVKDGKLKIESADGAAAVCESLTIPADGHPAVEVTVEGKHVHVRSGAQECARGRKCCLKDSPQDSLVGSALRVSRNGPKGCVLTLDGDATLTLVRQGKKAEITADRVSVNLVTGQVEGQIGHPPQEPQVVPCTNSPPPGPPADPVPTCTTASPDGHTPARACLPPVAP